jgi:hypothetical protein
MCNTTHRWQQSWIVLPWVKYLGRNVKMEEYESDTKRRVTANIKRKECGGYYSNFTTYELTDVKVFHCDDDREVDITDKMTEQQLHKIKEEFVDFLVKKDIKEKENIENYTNPLWHLGRLKA